jgi:hypothetical protein
VIVHELVLTSARNTTVARAARQASEQALDALAADANFVRRICDCQAKVQARKAQKKTAKEMLRNFGEDEMEMENALNT